MFEYVFMQRGLVVGILLGIVVPLVGVTIVLRRLSMIGDALSHTSLAGVAGGLIGDNMVTAREESQMLEVDISLATGKVSDYNFTEEKNRTQSWGVNKGVSPL